MARPSVATWLLTATLIAIVGFLIQTISFALDDWLSLEIFFPPGSSPNEPATDNVTLTAKFGLWEIGVYQYVNGSKINETSAKLFDSPDSWSDGVLFVEDLKLELLKHIHSNLLAAEILVSMGMAFCFFVAVGMTLHKFAPQLESNMYFLFASNSATLLAGKIFLVIAFLQYLNTF